jgi:MoxR-like ATPase
MPVAGHDIIKARMRITDTRGGVATFLREKDNPLPRELVSTSREFQNRKFKGYTHGTVVIATFRISETGRRYLLNVRDAEGGATTEMTDDVAAAPKEMIVDGFYFAPDVRRVFTIADKVAKKLGMITLLMVGPSGYGKTSIPERFAQITERNHVRVNCAAIRDPEEWLGFREAKDGTTVFEPTEFARAIQQGNSVIVLDEINRLEPWLHNTLFPLLDDDRATTIHNKRFEVADNTIFVLTLNQGVEFTGTFELDQAFMNRVSATMHVGQLPEEAEVQVLTKRTSIKAPVARDIVKVGRRLREVSERHEAEVDCSTRATLRIADLHTHGHELRACFHDVIEAAASDVEARKKLSDVINTMLEPFKERIGTDDIFDSSS